MKLITPRLILRPGTKKDINDVVEGINNLNVSKWLLVVPYPYERKDAIFWINKNIKLRKKKDKSNLNFFIELKKEKKVIGGIGLSEINSYTGNATIGYWISEKYWQKGYGSEALNAVLNHAFEKLKLRRINADVFFGNPSSGKLLEKFGGVQEGIKRKARRSKANGKIYDEIVYGILKEDWQKAVKKLKTK
jgi:[ribosomal protein S5]-alanine N-acetyltransferase